MPATTNAPIKNTISALRDLLVNANNLAALNAQDRESESYGQDRATNPTGAMIERNAQIGDYLAAAETVYKALKGRGKITESNMRGFPGATYRARWDAEIEPIGAMPESLIEAVHTLAGDTLAPEIRAELDESLGMFEPIVMASSEPEIIPGDSNMIWTREAADAVVARLENSGRYHTSEILLDVANGNYSVKATARYNEQPVNFTRYSEIFSAITSPIPAITLDPFGDPEPNPYVSNHNATGFHGPHADDDVIVSGRYMGFAIRIGGRIKDVVSGQKTKMDTQFVTSGGVNRGVYNFYYNDRLHVAEHTEVLLPDSDGVYHPAVMDDDVIQTPNQAQLAVDRIEGSPLYRNPRMIRTDGGYYISVKSNFTGRNVYFMLMSEVDRAVSIAAPLPGADAADPASRCPNTTIANVFRNYSARARGFFVTIADLYNGEQDCYPGIALIFAGQRDIETKANCFARVKASIEAAYPGNTIFLHSCDKGYPIYPYETAACAYPDQTIFFGDLDARTGEIFSAIL